MLKKTKKADSFLVFYCVESDDYMSYGKARDNQLFFINANNYFALDSIKYLVISSCHLN